MSLEMKKDRGKGQVRKPPCLVFLAWRMKVYLAMAVWRIGIPSVRCGSVQAPEKGLIFQATQIMIASQVYATALKEKWYMLISCKALMALVLRVTFLTGEPKPVDRLGDGGCDEKRGSGIVRITVKSPEARNGGLPAGNGSSWAWSSPRNSGEEKGGKSFYHAHSAASKGENRNA